MQVSDRDQRPRCSAGRDDVGAAKIAEPLDSGNPDPSISKDPVRIRSSYIGSTRFGPESNSVPSIYAPRPTGRRVWVKTEVDPRPGSPTDSGVSTSEATKADPVDDSDWFGALPFNRACSRT